MFRLNRQLNRQILLSGLAFILFLSICDLSGCSLLNPLDIDVQISVKEDTEFFMEEYINVHFSYEVQRVPVEEIITLEVNNQIDSVSYIWESGNHLLLKPKNGWKLGCNYKFKLNGNIKTESKGTFSASESRHFIYGKESELFSLENYPLKEFETSKDSVVFVFSRPVKHSSFMSGFSVSPYSEYDVSFSDDNKTATVIPEENWPINSILGWSLSSDIVSDDGYALKKEYSGEIKAVYDLAVPELIRVCPASLNSQEYLPLYTLDLSHLIDDQAIYFEFSKPMDSESVEKGISFEPAIKGCFYNYDNERRKFIYQPYSNYELNVEYRLKVDDSCKDINNIELFEPNEFYFSSSNEYLKVMSIKIKSPDEQDAAELCSSDEYSTVRLLKPDSLVYITIVFSESIKDKNGCEDNISCSVLFPDAENPEKHSCVWDSDFSVTLAYSNFFSKSGFSHFYKISVKGTSSGVVSESNNFMEKNKCVFFQTSL